MFQEVFGDYGNVAGPYVFTGWHCLICGTIIDELILAHQAKRHESRLRRTRLKTESMSVTVTRTNSNR